MLRSLVLAVVSATVLGACSVSGLSFVQDHRVDVVAPAARAKVTTPLTVRWTHDDFRVGRGAGSFGVLLDRQPPPPGRSLEWLFRGDESCRPDNGCPDEQYLVDRGVFRTTENAVTIERIFTDPEGGREFHEVTVILLDTSGRRVGESAWSVEFELETDD